VRGLGSGSGWIGDACSSSRIITNLAGIALLLVQSGLLPPVSFA